MGIQGDKTKPQSVMTFTVSEVHIVPGTNKITIAARSDDAEVKVIHKTIDIQAKIDAMNVTLLNNINGFINGAVADLLEVEGSAVTGELFSKSS